MALIEQGILGAFRGKCGNIIGYIRNGVPCIRSMPTHYRDRRSQRQLENRSRLSMVMKAMSLTRPVISLGFSHLATDMTAMNAATKANYYTLVKASSHGLRYDFSRLILSQGPVEPLSNLMVCVHQSTIDMIWNGLSVPGGSQDQVSVVLLNTQKMALTFSHAIAPRQQGHLTLSIPTGWQGDELYCYTLVERASDWSDSQCIATLQSQQPTPKDPQDPKNQKSPNAPNATQDQKGPKDPKNIQAPQPNANAKAFLSHQSAVKDLFASGPPRPDD